MWRFYDAPAIALPNSAMNRIAFENRGGLGITDVDAARVAQCIACQPSARRAIDVNADVAAVLDQVIFGNAVAVLDGAAGVAPERIARTAVTKREADSCAGNRGAVFRAANMVAENMAAHTATFHEDTVGRSITALLDEVGDAIVRHSPMTGTNEIDGRRRTRGFAGATIGNYVVVNLSMVWPITIESIDFDMGVEFFNAVVPDQCVARFTDHMNGMLAVAVLPAISAKAQVLEHPIGSCKVNADL